MVGVADPQDVPCILYQSMLEPPSGPEEGPVLLTSEANAVECTVHAPVWATRRRPYRMRPLEAPFGRRTLTGTCRASLLVPARQPDARVSGGAPLYHGRAGRSDTKSGHWRPDKDRVSYGDEI